MLIANRAIGQFLFRGLFKHEWLHFESTLTARIRCRQLHPRTSLSISVPCDVRVKRMRLAGFQIHPFTTPPLPDGRGCLQGPWQPVRTLHDAYWRTLTRMAQLMDTWTAALLYPAHFSSCRLARAVSRGRVTGTTWWTCLEYSSLPTADSRCELCWVEDTAN